jgi:hypothetical protein
MDNIIQKFYSNGKDTQNYGHLGAFSSSMITNRNPISSLKQKTIADFKPINTVNNINNSLNPTNYTNNIKTFTPQRNTKMTQQEFLKPKKLVFNSSSDMLYHNPFKFNQRGELSLLKENVSYENKKNATKIQKKMKNLELKNQRLEVINDFFFDIFENNLVKDEINRQRLLKAKEEDKNYYDDSESESNYFRKRKKHKKFHKSKSEVYLNKYDYRKNEFDALSFQQKTAQNARTILDNIKKNLGTYLIEEELKKNEQFQSINEGISELKSDLTNKLERIQKKQNQQMQKIAFCLLNSGDDKIEDLALRLFNNDYSNINNIENINNKKTPLYNQFKEEEDENNENDINEIQANDINDKRNSGRSSLGNNFRSNASSKRTSLKKNQSQMNITRKPIVRFKEEY